MPTSLLQLGFPLHFWLSWANVFFFLLFFCFFKNTVRHLMHARQTKKNQFNDFIPAHTWARICFLGTGISRDLRTSILKAHIQYALKFFFRYSEVLRINTDFFLCVCVFVVFNYLKTDWKTVYWFFLMIFYNLCRGGFLIRKVLPKVCLATCCLGPFEMEILHNYALLICTPNKRWN